MLSPVVPRPPPPPSNPRRAAVTKEMEALWGKMGAELGKGLPRSAFLLNQYAAAAHTYAERGVAAEDSAPLNEAHNRALNAYVDEAVDAHFRVFTGWVKKVESGAVAAAKAKGLPLPAPAAGAPPAAAYLPEGIPVAAEQAEAEAIVRDFALNWRGGLSALNDDVSRFFGRGGGGAAAGGAGASSADLVAASAAKTSAAVLMGVFQKVAEFHTRFTAVVARAFPGNPPFTREVVALPTVYAEMRRYGRQG
jgi:hypothetical protein